MGSARSVTLTKRSCGRCRESDAASGVEFLLLLRGKDVAPDVPPPGAVALEPEPPPPPLAEAGADAPDGDAGEYGKPGPMLCHDERDGRPDDLAIAGLAQRRAVPRHPARQGLELHTVWPGPDSVLGLRDCC